MLSKVLEKVITDQLVAYLNKHNIWALKQSGFRKGFRCTTAFLNIINDIICEFDRGNPTVL